MGGLDIEEITSPAGLDALRPAWLDLWERAPDATPFQSPAWLLPWWRHFGQGELLTLAVRRGGDELVGLAPLYVYPEPSGRKLLPLGVGISDYLDPLLAPGHEAEAAAAVLDHLGRRADRFDRCDLECLRPGSPLLDAALPPGWTASVHAAEPCPVLALPDDPADLDHAVPRLAKHAYYLRRSERLGATRLEAATRDTVGPLLDALFALHAARWTGRGEPGVLADATVRAFHCEAAPALLDLGLLRLYGLGIDGRTVAVFYGLADRTRAHAYIGGFDPDVAHPGLGALMIGHAVPEAAREGKREFHFLRGREPYKYAWGAVDRAGYGRRLVPARDAGLS